MLLCTSTCWLESGEPPIVRYRLVYYMGGHFVKADILQSQTTKCVNNTPSLANSTGDGVKFYYISASFKYTLTRLHNLLPTLLHFQIGKC